MSQYVNKIELKLKLEQLYEEKCEAAAIEGNEVQSYIALGINRALNLLDEIQSSDMKQIIHAEWINVPAGIPLLKLGHRYDDWKCSNCGTIADVRNSHNLGKYCSHCGAAMKGV